jgi:hypothetical protein
VIVVCIMIFFICSHSGRNRSEGSSFFEPKRSGECVSPHPEHGLDTRGVPA